MNNIGVDIDGVLNNFMEDYKKFCNDKYGNFQMGIINEERLRAFYESDIFNKLPPENGSLGGIEKLSKHYNLHIVSARPFYMKESTIMWLENYFPKMFKSFNFTNLNEDGDKCDICKKLECILIIEDEVTFMKNLKKDDKNFKVYLYTRDYNINIKSEPNIIRIDNWKKIIDLLVEQKV